MPTYNPPSSPTKPAASALLSVITYRMRLSYYRYQVNFGLYVMNPYEKLFVNLFVMSTLGLSLYYLLPSVLGALAFPIVKSMPDVFFMPTKDSPLHIEHGLRRLNAGLMTVRKGGAEAGQIYQCKRSIMEAVTFFIGSQLEMKEE